MTWATTKDQGSGTLAYRLAIAGCPYGFVTHGSMVKPAATPPRIGGLKVNGGKLKAIANIASGELDVSSLSCSIVDLGEQGTLAFGKQPTARTWITANVTTSATSMTVRSVAGLPTSGSLWLDSEAITYTSTAPTTGTISGMTRGALSTIAQAHYVDAGGSLRFPEVTNLPQTWAGRRAVLYIYGENDDPQGDGTQIWRGIVSREPTFSGSEWRFSIDPITSVLTRQISGDLAEPCQPRGISYTWCRPFWLRVFRKRDGTHQAYTAGDAEEGKVAFPIVAGDTAAFESNEDFCRYLTTKLAAMVSDLSWTETITAIPEGDDGWHLQVATPSSDVRGVWFEGPGGIDPMISVPRTTLGVVVNQLVASTIYNYPAMPESLPGAGSVPRGYYGDAWPLGPVVNSTLSGTYPARRLYLSGAAAISSLTDAAAISWKTYGDWPEIDEVTYVVTSDATDRYLDLGRSTMPSRINYFHGFTSACLPDIRLGRNYTSGGSIWTALNAMVSAAPAGLNSGAVPDLQAADFDSTSWDDLDATWQPRIVRQRTFRSFSDVTLLDIVREELKLAGYAMGISITGTLAIFPLRRPVSTEAGAVSVPRLVVDKQVPSWSPSGVGLVNTILVRRGYQPLEDDYSAANIVVRDVAAFGQSPRPRAVTIEPKSTPAGGIEVASEVVEAAQRLFGVLAFPYAMVSCDVGLRYFDTLTPGAIAVVTSPHLPNISAGTRGVEDMAALVTGREVELDSGRISLTLYVPLTRVAGYAPSAKLTANANVSGNTYDLTCDTYTFTGSTDASDWFIVGDRVRVWRWDSTTAGTLVGTVVSGGAGGNVRRVTFDGAWTPGADTWMLAYAATNDASLATSQLVYVALAESTGRIDAATDIDAWGFA